jgi:hypothetical protein
VISTDLSGFFNDYRLAAIGRFSLIGIKRPICRWAFQVFFFRSPDETFQVRRKPGRFHPGSLRHLKTRRPDKLEENLSGQFVS